MTSKSESNFDLPDQELNQNLIIESDSQFSLNQEFYQKKKKISAQQTKIYNEVDNLFEKWKKRPFSSNHESNRIRIQSLYYALQFFVIQLIKYCVDIKKWREKFFIVFEFCAKKIQTIFQILIEREQQQYGYKQDKQKLNQIAKCVRILEDQIIREKNKEVRFKLIKNILDSQGHQLKKVILSKLPKRRALDSDEQVLSEESFNPDEYHKKQRKNKRQRIAFYFSQKQTQKMKKRVNKIINQKIKDSIMNSFKEQFQKDLKSIEDTNKEEDIDNKSSNDQENQRNVSIQCNKNDKLEEISKIVEPAYNFLKKDSNNLQISQID